jgi:predicted HTH domain antitoxin
MTITVPLPIALERTMPPARAKLHLAIGAFAAEEVTLGQAAEIAGVSQTELMRELSRRRIPLHYDSEEFAEDLQTIARLNDRHQ